MRTHFRSQPFKFTHILTFVTDGPDTTNVVFNNAERLNKHVSTKFSLKTFAVRICHQFHFLLRSMEYTVLNVQFSVM